MDDSESFRFSAGCYLARQEGCRLVGVAASGEEALARIPGARADLVLVDVAMPDMSGFDLVRRLKAAVMPPQTAMIAVHDELEYRRAAEAAGAGGLIAKSEFTWQVLLMIRSVAERLGLASAPSEPSHAP